MTEMPVAYIGHAVPGRLRIKIPARRSDGAFFARLRQELATCPGVWEVQDNPVVGSLLIRHEGDINTIARYAAEKRLFRFASHQARMPPVGGEIKARLGTIDTRVSEILGHRVDLRTSVFVGLLGLAAAQVLRGQVLAPAVTLAWYAATLAMWPKKEGSDGEEARALPAPPDGRAQDLSTPRSSSA